MTGAVPRPRAGEAVLDLTGPVPVIVVDGGDWLDVGTAPAVERVLADALARRPPRLAVDLRAVTMADAYGVGMLARMRARASQQGTELFLVEPSRRVRRLLHLVGLADALPVRTLEEVEAG